MSCHTLARIGRRDGGLTDIGAIVGIVGSDRTGREEGPPEADAAASSVAVRGVCHQQTNQRLHVEFDGQDFQLEVSVALAQEGHLYVRPRAGGSRLHRP